ncbi:MAG: hypothetical protein EOO75_05750, partial [Myxococcales bacterium]
MDVFSDRPGDEQALVKALAARLGCAPAALWHVLPARSRRVLEGDRLARLDLPWGHNDDDLEALGRLQGDLTLGPSATLQGLTLGAEKLASLTLAGLPSLAALDLSCERLTSLDLGGCPALEVLTWRGPTPGSVRHAPGAGARYARVQHGDGGLARLLPPGDRLLSLDWSGDAGDGALSLSDYPRLVTLDMDDATLGALDLAGCAALLAVSLDDLRGLRSLTLPASVRSVTIEDLVDLEELDVSACEALSDLDVTGCKRLKRLVCTPAQATGVKGLQRKGLAGALVDAAPAVARATVAGSAAVPMPEPPASDLGWRWGQWTEVTERWLDARPEADTAGAAARVRGALTALRERVGQDVGFGVNLGVNGAGA